MGSTWSRTERGLRLDPAGWLLKTRCEALLQQYPTTLDEDQTLISQTAPSPNLLLALRIRTGKKTILLTALSS